MSSAQKMPADAAQQAVKLLEQAVLSVLKQHPDGLGNADVARALDLLDPPGERQKNYLTWKILRRLEIKGIVEETSDPEGRRKKFRAK